MKRLNNYTTMKNVLLYGCMFFLLPFVNGQTNNHTVHKQSTVNPDLIIKFSGGEGTKESPYILSTLTDLKQLADSVSFGKSPDERNNWSFNKYFVLSNDITDDSLRIPIGTLSRPFQGNFDGKGFNISLAIDSESDYTGLFGYLLHANIQQVVVSGYVIGNKYIGGISGYAEKSSISACTNTAVLSIQRQK
ncbi:MAG TPA: hypothetical protein PKX15_01230 [Bacteroidales bacterium]|nr:hypothetical protein [Bacteroidales bacterium]